MEMDEAQVAARQELERVLQRRGDRSRLNYLLDRIEERHDPFAVRSATPIHEITALRIRMLRKLAGWTQEELAAVVARAGAPWSRQTVADIENLKRRVSVSECLVLGALFGVPALSLMLTAEPGSVTRLESGQELNEELLFELLVGPEANAEPVGSDWEAARTLLGPGLQELAADLEHRRGRQVSG